MAERDNINYRDLYGKWDYKTLRYCGSAPMSVIPGGYTLFTPSGHSTNSTHLHRCYELCYALEGTGEFICGGESHTVVPGDIFIADPDVLHEIRLPNKSEKPFAKFYYLIDLGTQKPLGDAPGAETVSDASIVRGFLCSHGAVLSGEERFVGDYFSRFSELRKNNDYVGLYHASYDFIIETLARLSNSGCESDSVENEAGSVNRVLFEASLRYISTKIYSPLTVRDVADGVHTSVRNLEYMYRRYMSMTVKSYITSVKLNAAASNLRMSAKVSETAELLCFDDVSSFTRLFKKNMGVTPKKYQLKYNETVNGGNVFGTVFVKEPLE